MVALYDKTEIDDLYLHWALTEEHHNPVWKAPHQRFHPNDSIVW